MNITKKNIVLVATLASTFFITGCTTESVKDTGPEIIEKSRYFSDPAFAHNDDSWKDIPTWIDSIPEIDRVPEISQALNRKDLTSLQRETLYNRLTKISNSENYVIQWAQSRIDEKNYAGALELLKKPQFTDTKNPQVLYLQGRSLLALKRYDEANEALLTAIHYNEANGDYYNALAYVSFARGQSSRAEAALNKSINVDKNQPYALYNMGVTKYNDEMYDDALEYFTKSALLYKDEKQDDKVTKVINDIFDMAKYIEKEKIKRAIKQITKGETL